MFGLSTFLYRYVCDNRMIWGASNVQGGTDTALSGSAGAIRQRRGQLPTALR